MNKSSADDLAKKERHSIEISLMQDTIRKQLLIDQYIDLWSEYHGYHSPNSDQKDTVDDKTDKVDNKDDTDADNVDTDEDVEVKVDKDESFVPEDEPDDDDDEEDDDAVCDHEDNPDDVGEDKAGEGVKEIVQESECFRNEMGPQL
jgi:hypothetical protein